MDRNISVRLGNPVVMFFWSAAVLLTGIVIGACWHPSRALVVATGVAAGVFMVLHELLCCFVWCSLSAWWIGRRTYELKDGRQK
jgi:hypothetical protein